MTTTQRPAPDRRAFLSFSAAAAALAACETPRGGAASRAVSDLGAIDAVETARRIKAGELSALQAVDAAIARTARANASLNAVVVSIDEAARARAAANPQGPMGGVPFAIKDLNGWPGTTTGFGSRALGGAPYAPTPFIERVAEIGLIPIAKTATPEIGATATTEPVSSGVCRNPWNPRHSAGGSSGGTAALVAAGALAIAHANDGGGSIRIPAAACGLVGLKPSRGRLIAERPPARPAATDLSVQGCVSRTVRDTAAFLAAMEAPNPDLAPMGLVTRPLSARLKIGWTADAPTGVPVDPEVRAAVEDAVALCARLGHATSPHRPTLDAAAFEDAFMLLWAAGSAQTVQRWSRAAGRAPTPEDFEPWTLHLAAKARGREADVPKAIETLERFARDHDALMLSGIDVLVTPVLTTPAPEIGHLSPTLPGEVHEARVRAYAAFTPMQNVAGTPAISLPLGMSRSGLPIGIQFAARAGHDALLLALAYELEAAAPWSARRPQVWVG